MFVTLFLTLGPLGALGTQNGLLRGFYNNAAAHIAKLNASLGNDVGDTAWNSAISQAHNIVKQMTLEDMNNITYGFAVDNGCSGNSGSLPRLDYPGMCLHDGPAGAKGNMVTGFASGVSVAASFNTRLAEERAFYMGAEFKRKGAQVANGPVVGPIGRLATDGRAWEGFGADRSLGAVTVKGLQKSVIAAVKHYILNEQETNRYSSGNATVSEDASDTTLHELYLTPFQDAIHAGAAAVMCAYNRINSTYACENDRTLNQILKGELNFPGFVLSDWVFGQKSGIASATNGLDMAMPMSNGFWANEMLAKAVDSGKLAKARLQDMATRILASWFLITPPGSSSKPPGHGLPADVLASQDLTDARNPASRASTLQSAVEGHVLVKNVNNTLPFRETPKVLSLFGWDAIVPPVNNAGSDAYSPWELGFQSVNISTEDALKGLVGTPVENPPAIAELGVFLSGSGSGTTTPSYMSDAHSAFTHKAAQDGTTLFWDFKSIQPLVVQSSQACLVFINQWRTETIDIPTLADEKSDKLVKNVASNCSNTIVVIHNAWIRLVDAWIEHPNVTAVMFAHLPGQDGGRALVDLLYGKESPSGKLPYTVAKQASDYGDLLSPAKKLSPDGGPHAVYNEGIKIDYRRFLDQNIEPRYPFGFGLSYSTFKIADIKAMWFKSLDLGLDPPNPTTLVPGGSRSLFESIAAVSVTLTNEGSYPAAEVAQLYVQRPGDGKLRHLRGYAKEKLLPGESVLVQMKLKRRDLSQWSEEKQQWQLARGQYKFFAGTDVNDAVKLTASLAL